MQSYGDSFSGDVVLESSIMASRDEGSVLDQIYEAQIFLDFYHEDLTCLEYLRKMDIWRNAALYNKELIKLSLSDTLMLVCIFV